MNNSMSKSWLKSILTLQWLVGMTKINRTNSLISIVNDADLKVTTRSVLKKHHTAKTKNAVCPDVKGLKENFIQKQAVNTIMK